MNNTPALEFAKKHATIPLKWRLVWFLRGMLNPFIGKPPKETTDAQVQKCVSEMSRRLYKNPKYRRLVLEEFRKQFSRREKQPSTTLENK